MNTVYTLSPFGLSTIGRRYVLGEILGEGGMGIVYRATDRLTGQQVALKRVTMPSDRDTSQELITQAPEESLRVALANEFRLLASLRHPNVISVLDYGVDEWRQPYYTMELLTGSQPLLQAAQGQSIDDKLILIVQILQALSYLHRHDIIHRDLTPDNVHVIDQQVKIIDFGLAMLTDHERSESAPAGTLAYMAPEVLLGNSPTSAADLYAVGVIAYELLAGQHPLDYRQIDLNTFTQQLLEDPPDLAPLPTSEGIRAVIGKLLAKKPAERFQSAHECIEALNEAYGDQLIEESDAIRESFVRAARFVGRDKEIKRLNDALTEAEHGSGSAWLVGGDSGVGKSRLLDEIHNRAMLDGFLVLRGQSVQDAAPFSPLWREPIRRLALMTELSDHEIGILQMMVPDIGELVGRTVPTIAFSENDQQRLHATIVDMFKRQRQPLLLLLEDLQWAEDSLQPLRLLSALVNSLPLMILGAYRTDERPGLPHELPFVNTLFIERLNEADILSLSQSMIGEIAKRPSVMAIIQQESEGNAFFITEVVRTLAEATGRLEDIGEVTLPPRFFAEGIRNVIRHRLLKLPVEDRTFFKITALIGRQLNLMLLHVMFDAATVERHILRGSELAIIEIRDNRWRFSHDHLREALLADMGDVERQAAHLRIARAIESIYPNDDAHVMSLFEHCYAAKDMARAAFYAQKVGAQLLTSGDFAGALERIERILRVFDSQYSPDVTVRLLTLAGRAHQLLGNFKLAIGTYERGVAFARRHGQVVPAAELNALIGSVHAEQGNFAVAKDYLEDAVSAAQTTAHHHLLMVSLCGLGRVELMLGNYAQAQLQLQAAYHYAHELNHGTGLIYTSGGLAILAADQYRTEDARTRFEVTTTLAREHGNQRDLIHTLLWFAEFLQQQGDYDAAFAYLEECQQICHETGDKRSIGPVLGMIGTLYYALGELATARAYLDESVEQALLYDDKQQQGYDYNVLANILREQGDLAAAVTYGAEALQLLRKMGERRSLSSALCGLAQTKLRMGKVKVAASLHHKSLALAEEIAAFDLIMENHAHLGLLELQSGATTTAANCLMKGLHLALTHHDYAHMATLMLGVAHLYAHTNLPRRSAELYGLLAQHPRLSAILRAGLLTHLDATLRQLLPDNERQALAVGGQALDLESAARSELAFWSAR